MEPLFITFVLVSGMGIVLALGHSSVPVRNGWVHEDLRKSWNYTRDFSIIARNRAFDNLR